MAVDDYWKQLQQVNEVVRYADAKAGLILTVDGLLVGVAGARIQGDGLFDRHPAPASALLAAIVFLTASLGLDIAAIMPRLTSPGQAGASIMHFGAISDGHAKSRDDFVDAFAAIAGRPDHLERELGRQIWANSLVARRKYAYIRWSLRLLAVAVAATVLAAVIAAFGG